MTLFRRLLVSPVAAVRGFGGLEVPCQLDIVEGVGELLVFVHGDGDALLPACFSDSEALGGRADGDGFEVDLSRVVDLVAGGPGELVDDHGEVGGEGGKKVIKL